MCSRRGRALLGVQAEGRRAAAAAGDRHAGSGHGADGDAAAGRGTPPYSIQYARQVSPRQHTVCHTGFEPPQTSKLQRVLLLTRASPALDSMPTTCSCTSSRRSTTILSTRSCRSSASSGATPTSRRGCWCTSSSGQLTGAARYQAADRRDVSRVAAHGEHGVCQSLCCQAILSP